MIGPSSALRWVQSPRFGEGGTQTMTVSEQSRIPQTLMQPLDQGHDWLWCRRTIKSSGRRAKRERPREPLVLCGHGVSLRIEGGALTVRNGLTHYPQKHATHRFFKGDLDLPTRIIMLDGSGSLSFDVLSWLAEQDVSLVRIDWRGLPAGLCRESLSSAVAARNAL
jgi:hypothetical protein